MILQPQDDAYTANNVTRGLATLGGRSGVSYLWVDLIKTDTLSMCPLLQPILIS